MSAYYELIRTEFINFEYSGESIQVCLNCGIEIQDGERILREVFRVMGHDDHLVSLWHIPCWYSVETVE